MTDPTTIGTLMLNDSLPDDLRLGKEPLDKKALTKLLRGIAEKYPDRYKEVLKTLNDVGRSAAYTEGVTVSLSGLKKSQREKDIVRRARARVLAIAASDRPDAEKKQALIDTMLPMVEKIQEVLKEEAEAEDNPYWFQVKSGARGKMDDFNAIRGALGLVNDHRNELVPVPILHSLGEGLDPAEYWAGTYGQRRGMIDVKFSQVLDTQVLMSDLSSRRLGDIKAGDVVMGSDSLGRLTPTRVVALHDHGIQETWRYTFRRNFSKETIVLEATPDHRMLSRVVSSHTYRTDKTPKKRALKEAKLFKNPQKNEYICVPPVGGDIGDISEPRALFYGVIAGGGPCGSNAHSTAVSQADPLFLAEFGVYMAEFGVSLKKAGKAGYDYRLSSTCENPKGGRDCHVARLWLEDAGMWGKLDHETVLPPRAGLWDNASMASFIAGYASSAGCVDIRGGGAGVSFSICSMSSRLLEQIRDHLLFRWGIHATLSPVKPRGSHRPQTKLSITLPESVELFAAVMPLIGQKRDQLAAALASSPPGRLFPAGYKIVSAEPIGRRHVADLEVEHPDHLFVLANGLITSNSVGDAGFLNKQLVNAAHRILVNKEKPPETRLPVGLPVEVDDEDNVGAVLAKDAGPFKAGTVLTKDAITELKDQGITDILIHSPMTEPSEDGGVSRYAAGRRDRPGLSLIGDNIGIPAAQSLGERLAQGMLDCLAEGTEVRMADWSVKPIQDLRPGDWVLGADKGGNTFPVRVNHLFDQGSQPCWTWRFGDAVLVSTAEHKVLSHAGGVVRLNTNPSHIELRVASPTATSAEVVWLKRRKPIDVGVKQCWDIEVDHPDHLFVLANGLIVSNSKHQAGATGTDKVSRAGFEYINRLIQSPVIFPEAGPLSELEGLVRAVREAPQGGHYIQVEDQEYYAGEGINPVVKPGQRVDIGDELTDGIPHPEQLVRLHGHGEARRRYLQILQEGLKNSGINIHRRNAEAVVAGLLNWVKITDPEGYDDHIVDDIVSYNAVAGKYQPREGAEIRAPNRSIGRYLEEPVLHYTPGTRISKKVADDLKKWGIKDVSSHAQEPRFQPYMQRGMLGVYNDEDWQTRLSGFYTTSAFLDSVHRGRTSDPNSTSFVPAIARGTNFGQDLETRGTYGASDIVPPSPAPSVR